MSRYPMPFLSEDRGCFCCGPPVPSSTFVRGMLGQQFQGLNCAAGSSNSRVPNNLLSAQDISADAIELSPLLQEIHLTSSYLSPLSWNSLPGNDMADHITYGCEMHSNQNVRENFGLVNYANNPSVDEILASRSSSLNFRMLQNREMGKISGNLPNTQKEVKQDSSSATVDSIGYNPGVVMADCEDTMACSNKVNADSMDLDSALDELGMLSTITNSRRQYLIETRGQTSFKKREQRLRSKSESSPNLTTLGPPNGFRIVHLDPKFVTGLTDMLPPSNLASISLGNSMPLNSQLPCLEYRDVLENAVRRRRSVPRMSRMRKDWYRRSRCPYKIPNRLCNSMQESDFGPEYFETCASPFISSNSASESGVDRLRDTQHLSESKSSTASPVKPHHDLKLTRSLSAEDLAPIRHRLELELNEQAQQSSRTEQSLDLMTSQMINLHMS